jgi:glucose-1-phosphate adenylyltransferase
VINVAKDGRVAQFIEKPANPSPYATNGRCLINLGVYCFQTRFLVQQLVADAKTKTAHDFGRNILPASLSAGRVLSCPLEVISPDRQPYWRDVGSIDSYFQASMDLLATPARFDLTDPRWPADSRFNEWVPARYTVKVRLRERWVKGRNLVASGVEVDEAQVVNSILSPRVRVGAGAELEECVVLPGSRVGEGARLRRVIVEEGAQIPAGARIGFGGDSKSFVTSPGGVVVVSGGAFPQESEVPEVAFPGLNGTGEEPPGSPLEPAAPVQSTAG